MKSRAWASVLALGLATPAGAAIITTSNVAPTLGPDDIAQPLFDAPMGWDADGNDFTNSPTPGQSFLTPNTSGGGYDLSKVTVKGVGTGAAAAGSSFNIGTWNIRISSIIGNTLTPIAIESADATALPDDGQFTYYITFNLDNSVHLNPNTEYAFDLFGDHGYFALAAAPTRNDPYAGGAALNSGASGGFTSNSVAFISGKDRTFYLALAANAAPEPATVMLIGIGSMVVMSRRRRAR